NPFTDDQLASRFSARHADGLLYVSVKGQWYQWDDARWRPEPTLLAFDLARQSCRHDAEEFGIGKGGAPPGVSSAKTVADVERMARADRRHATHIDELDADDLAFTTAKATFDLTTSASRPPRPEDMNTKLAGCACAPAGAAHPIFDARLRKIRIAASG